ncbi:hypothetical protein TNCT_160901 [Trichonephila clavata]|uniref:Uncharacterized protein n=1 Tax=Trichonephila clavata TaxID=2740835 RepID=A0A8X6FIZ7_TRICU|nr:hypothetical protein TNCT_160901 [Trichonephila clavata]
MVLKATQWRRLAIFQNQFRRKDTVTHLFLGHNPTALGETKNVSFRGASQHHIFPQVSNKKYLRKERQRFLKSTAIKLSLEVQDFRVAKCKLQQEENIKRKKVTKYRKTVILRG